MIISCEEAIRNICVRCSVDEDVVDCLDVERLLDLGVRGGEEVKKRNANEKTCQENI